MFFLKARRERAEAAAQLMAEYRASAKGALAQGAISSTGTNSPSQVFYGNQFFVHVF